MSESGASASMNIDDLPVEWLMQVLDRLPLRQVFSSQRVSRRWRMVAHQVVRERRVFNASFDQMFVYPGKCPPSMVTAAASLTKLSVVAVHTKHSVNEELIRQVITSSASTLTHVSMVEKEMKMPENLCFPRLETLVGCFSLPLTSSFPRLKTLRLDPYWDVDPELRLPSLKVLTISGDYGQLHSASRRLQNEWLSVHASQLEALCINQRRFVSLSFWLFHDLTSPHPARTRLSKAVPWLPQTAATQE